jgi:hypothetical protein
MKKWHRVVLIASLVGSSTAPASSWALACFRTPDDELVARIEIAFVGKVIAVEESSYNPSPGLCWERSESKKSCGGQLATLEVSRRLRSRVPTTVRVLSEDVCYCHGANWKLGEYFLVTAKANDSSLPADLVALVPCSGGLTTRIDGAAASALADKLQGPVE